MVAATDGHLALQTCRKFPIEQKRLFRTVTNLPATDMRALE
jgi:hypothetical protein